MRFAMFFVVALASFCATPKSAVLNDANIEANIRAKFAKSKIAEERFQVTVKSGVALLEGKTDIPQRKGVATRLAKSGGAREVVNKIQIGEAARKKLSERLQKAREAKAAAPKSQPAATAPKVAARKPADLVKAPARNLAAVPATPVAPAEPPALRRMQIKH